VDDINEATEISATVREPVRSYSSH